MKVLFDFELQDDLGINAHLVDILLALKKALIKEMTPFQEEIESDKGEFVITFLKTDFNISYACRHPEKSNPKIKEIIDSYDWPNEISRFSKGELN